MCEVVSVTFSLTVEYNLRVFNYYVNGNTKMTSPPLCR
ncbi:hypothetical protein AAEX37_01999 [Oligella sp. MSHR50489EDL]